ncbi:hypothetical protein WN944_025905 [Citrus x changshan-huyou]|uniref:Uncharacterized protein n=1 Tax=Citrus x changshan-huyou TaxID=2935761 RepID=A0AAP0LRG8_9ROSI
MELQRYIKQYNDIELTASGMVQFLVTISSISEVSTRSLISIPTVVTIAEALKRDGLASNKEVKISAVNSNKDAEGRFFQKAKVGLFELAAGLCRFTIHNFSYLLPETVSSYLTFTLSLRFKLCWERLKNFEKAVVATTALKETSDTDMKA